MAVLIPGKILFLAQQHTGSMAVSEALRGIGGFFIAPGHITLEEIKLGNGWIEERGSPGKGPCAWRTMTGKESVVTTVRNPYDVIVTWYLRSMYPGTLEDYVDGVGRQFRSAYVKGDEIRWHPDAEIRMWHETLADDFRALLSAKRVEPVDLPVTNETPGKAHWARYYSERALGIVNERFHVEFAGMGYRMIGTVAELVDFRPEISPVSESERE